MGTGLVQWLEHILLTSRSWDRSPSSEESAKRVLDGEGLKKLLETSSFCKNPCSCWGMESNAQTFHSYFCKNIFKYYQYYKKYYRKKNRRRRTGLLVSSYSICHQHTDSEHMYRRAVS